MSEAARGLLNLYIKFNLKYTSITEKIEFFKNLFYIKLRYFNIKSCTFLKNYFIIVVYNAEEKLKN